MDEPVTLRELSAANRDDVLALRLAASQDRFVSSVAESLQEAENYPQANPWYRAVYAGDEPVGFVMLSWDCVPQPPQIIGPWFLWKLLIDERHQRHGHGREVVRLVTNLVREAGADHLLVSYVQGGEGGPGRSTNGSGSRPPGRSTPTAKSSCASTSAAPRFRRSDKRYRRGLEANGVLARLAVIFREVVPFGIGEPV